MALIELEEMEFHAHHGCFKEERIVGNSFKVNFRFETDTKNAENSDNLNDTINYQTVYSLIKEEMTKPSHLLEHVAHRILDKIYGQFPEIKKAEIKVSKLNPSMGGKIKSVSVILGKE
jgi:7,8-dihydroneopterin aldolase/epimerase/oxygenase